MIYQLLKASKYNSDEQRQRYEALGFTFELNEKFIYQQLWYDNTERNIFVDIDDIHEFIDEWGNVVIERNYLSDDAKYLLTIYDDYLE